ncbi:hypothetical protein HanRHA438_Chr10g0432851 [Helianthus annuus]|nr:hypothetical protein HanIR_Chr10g0453261 [Helianthus annuus]KAJ0877823.1 hypothetical protein HanRHA438_Chr10g0432851 [Helianthus annuus]
MTERSHQDRLRKIADRKKLLWKESLDRMTKRKDRDCEQRPRVHIRPSREPKTESVHVRKTKTEPVWSVSEVARRTNPRQDYGVNVG